MKKYIFIFTLLFCSLLFPQNYATNDAYNPNQTTANTNAAAGENSSITNDAVMGRKPAITETAITGFKDIRLGATREDTINAILSDGTMILPRKYMTGSVDITAEESATFLALEENKFYRSGYFIFKNDSLYSITIYFQPNQVDFLELLSALNSKYSKGAFLDANTVAWQNGNMRIILERPSIVKYINMNNITTTSETRIREKEETPSQNERNEILEGL